MPNRKPPHEHAWQYTGRRRRCCDQDGPQPGAVASRPRGARHIERLDAVALGRRRRGRSRHHRCRDARRERLRSPAAHQEGAPRPSGYRHERAEHVHDRHPGFRNRRLRISAEAVRPRRIAGDRQPRACRASAPARAGAARGTAGIDAAGRPFACHAGNLPHAGAHDADRSDGDDLRRIGHRQGAGGPRAARIWPPAERTVRRHQYGRDPT